MGFLEELFEPAPAVLPPPPARAAESFLDSLGPVPETFEPLDAPGDPDPLTGKRPVGDSKDLRRILKVPRRPVFPLAQGVELPQLQAAREALHAALALPGCDRRLRDIQVWALTELPRVGGGLCPVGVGHGKSLVDMLLPMVVGARHAVLLIPPNMRASFHKEWASEAKRWRLPNLTGGKEFVIGRPVLTVLAYSELSQPKNSDLLNQLNPDWVICDEAHKLKGLKSSCTERVRRFAHDHPSTRFVFLSGTLTTRSLKEYAHLSKFALGENSPLPLSWPTLDEWAGALDAPGKSGFQTAPGQLRRLCTGLEEPRDGFRRRLVETPGVISTTESSLGTSLIIEERKLTTSHNIRGMLETMRGPENAPAVGQEQRGTWERPDGEELITPTQLAESARELAAGFYLFWRYPRGESPELIEEWFAKRKAWMAELRKKLARPMVHMDSPLLATKAAIRWHDGYVWVDEAGGRHEEPPRSRKGPYPVWDSEHWPAWKAIRNEVQPQPGEKWVDEFLAQDAADWARKHVGIVWVHNNTLGQRIAELSGLPYYAGGAKASAQLVAEDGSRSVIASIPAHNASKNLQMFSRNLVTQCPSSGGIWEQLIGRTHRQGQMAEEIEVYVYRHTREYRQALEQALRDATYIQQTQGLVQKLCYASFGFDVEG